LLAGDRPLNVTDLVGEVLGMWRESRSKRSSVGGGPEVGAAGSKPSGPISDKSETGLIADPQFGHV
jgi:hypothetical protein